MKLAATHDKPIEKKIVTKNTFRVPPSSNYIRSKDKKEIHLVPWYDKVGSHTWPALSSVFCDHEGTKSIGTPAR